MINDLDAEACAECGACRPMSKGRRAPEAVDGRLSELRPEHFERIARLPYRRLVARRRSEPELRAYAEAHGYRPGWVWHRLREQEAG